MAEQLLHKGRPQGVIGDSLVIRGNLTPLPGSRGSGEVLPDGRPVFRVLAHLDSSGNYQKAKFKRVLVRDPDGTIQYHLRADGTKRAPMWALEPEEPIWVDYIIDDLGNNCTKINTHFRESPENIERWNKAERREREVERFLTVLEESQLSVEDIVRAIRGMPSIEDVVVPPEPEPAPELTGLAKANAVKAAKREAERTAANARASLDQDL